MEDDRLLGVIDAALQVARVLGNLQDYTNDDRVNVILQGARKQLLEAIQEAMHR